MPIRLPYTSPDLEFRTRQITEDPEGFVRGLADVMQRMRREIVEAVNDHAGDIGVYSSGSFTPALEFGGASTGITYSAQTGLYVKVGSLVWISVRINLTSKGTATGNATISGLPFTSSSSASHRAQLAAWYRDLDFNIGGGYYALAAYIGQSSDSVALQEIGDNVSDANLTEADFGNSTDIHLSGVYIAE